MVIHFSEIRNCRARQLRAGTVSGNPIPSLEGRAVPKPFTKKEAETFFSRLRAQNPEPKTELVYRNPYTLLVAVVLSAQATDKGVNKATEGLFKIADTPAKMVALGEKWPGRAHQDDRTLSQQGKEYVIALSEALLSQHGGAVPRRPRGARGASGSRPQDGQRGAQRRVRQPTIAVDTHIFRVANRTALAPGKTPREVEDGLEKIVPAAYLLHAHHWLILHGRYVCVARSPKCPECIERDLCRYTEKTELPGPRELKKAGLKTKIKVTR
jgi:endonuclease-3